MSSTTGINISTPTRPHFSEISEHHGQREGLACLEDGWKVQAWNLLWTSQQDDGKVKENQDIRVMFWRKSVSNLESYM